MIFNIKNLEESPFMLNIMDIGIDTMCDLIGEYKHKFAIYHKGTLKDFIKSKGYFVVEQSMNIADIDFNQIPKKDHKILE